MLAGAETQTESGFSLLVLCITAAKWLLEHRCNREEAECKINCFMLLPVPLSLILQKGMSVLTPLQLCHICSGQPLFGSSETKKCFPEILCSWLGSLYSMQIAKYPFTTPIARCPFTVISVTLFSF